MNALNIIEQVFQKYGFGAFIGSGAFGGIYIFLYFLGQVENLSVFNEVLVTGSLLGAGLHQLASVAWRRIALRSLFSFNQGADELEEAIQASITNNLSTYSVEDFRNRIVSDFEDLRVDGVLDFEAKVNRAYFSHRISAIESSVNQLQNDVYDIVQLLEKE